MLSLHTRWLKYFLFFTVLNLTTGFASAQQLTIGVFDEHDLYLKTSKPYQVGWHVLNRAARKAGIDIVPIEDAWARLMSDVERNRIDGIYGAMKSPERLAWAHFSAPLSSDSVQVFSYADAQINNVSDIDKSNAAVGVSKNSIQHQMAKDMGFKNIYAILDRNVLYKMLTAKRIDFLIFSGSFVNLYCYKYAPSKTTNCLKALEPVLAVNSIHVMFAKTQLELVASYEQLNAALSELYHSGEIKKIFSQYYDDEQPYLRWQTSFLAESQALNY